MSTVYQVANWNSFENNKSRERELCSYVCVPNKQHGMGLTRILSEADGAAIYGIWQLILGAVSRQKKPRFGWLTDDGHETGTAWAPRDLALLWRRPEPEIERALLVLSGDRIGWILLVSSPGKEAFTYVETPAVSAVPVSCPPSASEEKRREVNGIEETFPPPASPSMASVEGMKFAEWFKTLLPPNSDVRSNFKESWGKLYDDLLRLDKRTKEQVKAVSEWARRDSFWASNFQSPMKLRDRNPDGVKYFDVFSAKMQAPEFRATGPRIPTCPLPAHEVPKIMDIAAGMAARDAAKKAEASNE